ncbi:MAG: dipeptidase [Candidatus Aminicenantales bacterium]
MNVKKIGLVVIFFTIVLIFSLCKGREKISDARAGEIHERVLTADTHCDTPSLMLRGGFDIGERHEPGGIRSGQVDLPRMKQGGLDAAFFAVYVRQGERTAEGYREARERASKLLNIIHKMGADYPQLVGLATTPEDAYRLEKEGKRAVFIGMENGYPIGRDLSLLEEYYRRGVRYLTLCHSRDNDICDSSTDSENPEDNGLSEFGEKVVLECNRLGIMVDVSHISDQSFFDVLKVSQAPVIASHSGVRAVCDHPRNLSDEMLKALAENGGVIQVCFVSSFLKKLEPNPQREKALKELREKYGAWDKIREEDWEKVRLEYRKINEMYPEEKATVKELVDLIDHAVRLIGIDHVGIGSDFDGGGGVKGCDDVSQIPEVTKELIRRGYSEEGIRKIWGQNIMRVMRQVIETAEKIQASQIQKS